MGVFLSALRSLWSNMASFSGLASRYPLDREHTPRHLSKGASICFQSSPVFANYMERRSTSTMADFVVVVVPRVDRGVAEMASAMSLFRVLFLIVRSRLDLRISSMCHSS